MSDTDPISWTGDLDDDCTAHWEGLVLRAEMMDIGVWWWEVIAGGEVVDGSNELGYDEEIGASARLAAEEAARAYRARVPKDTTP